MARVSKKDATIYYCEYDGNMIFKYPSGRIIVEPVCENRKYEKDAIHMNSTAMDFISYGFKEV